jgi:hypothetical protein
MKSFIGFNKTTLSFSVLLERDNVNMKQQDPKQADSEWKMDSLIDCPM